MPLPRHAGDRLRRQNQYMPTPAPSVLPFRIEDGWPVRLAGCRVTLRETGILLGSLNFDAEEWADLDLHAVHSIRIDDHSATDGWSTRHPDGSEESTTFTIPMAPVPVPEDVLSTPRTFGEWVSDAHGSSGRLLVWDDTLTWWWAQDPELEALLMCAPIGRYSPSSDELSWLPLGTETGRRSIEKLHARFGIEVGTTADSTAEE
jgi:hypothetical protein